MPFVGLVHVNRRDLPDDLPARGRRPPWHAPWRALAWLAAICWLMALVPVADRAFGALVGYLVLLLAIGLAFWRIERWCARQYWRGLRDYQA